MKINEIKKYFEQNGTNYKCPAHDDEHASLSINEGENGRTLIRCHAGCDHRNVLKAVGLSESDLFVESVTTKTEKPVEVARYQYGQYTKIRKGKKSDKDFKDFHWTPKLNGVDPGLFRAERLKDAKTVFVCEGEKDVLTIEKLGYVAVCSPHGAGQKLGEQGKKWRENYNSLFTAKKVFICPDNDKNGYAFAEVERDGIANFAESVQILDLKAVYPTLKIKGDISDIFDAVRREKTIELLRKAATLPPPQIQQIIQEMQKAEEIQKAQETQKSETKQTDIDVVDNTIQELKPITDFIITAIPSTAKPPESLIADFLMRGTLNSIQGLPDSGKTWLTLSIAVAVASGGVFPDRNGDMMQVTRGKVLYANFDDDKTTIEYRLQCMGVTDEQAQNILILSAESCLTFYDSRLEELFDAVKPDLAIFDTLQHFIGAKTDLHRANETNAALLPLKTLTEKYNCATVITQHISKQSASGNGGSSVNWGLGSIAINGLFRSVWTVGALNRENDNPYRKALLASKTNQLPVKPPPRLFDLDPELGFLWAGIDETVTSNDLIRGDNIKLDAHRPADSRSKAEAFLLEVLDGGAIKSSDLTRFAEERGISERTLKRAKKSLDVKSYKDGKEWYFLL